MLLEAVTTHVPALPELDADRSEFGEISLKSRAEFGRAAVDVGTPDGGQGDERIDAVDTIVNILHHLFSDNPGATGSPRADPERLILAALRRFDAQQALE